MKKKPLYMCNWISIEKCVQGKGTNGKKKRKKRNEKECDADAHVWHFLFTYLIFHLIFAVIIFMLLDFCMHYELIGMNRIIECD